MEIRIQVFGRNISACYIYVLSIWFSRSIWAKLLKRKTSHNIHCYAESGNTNVVVGILCRDEFSVWRDWLARWIILLRKFLVSLKTRWFDMWLVVSSRPGFFVASTFYSDKIVWILMVLCPFSLFCKIVSEVQK